MSESRMGQALRDGYRGRVFLMTKFDGRDRAFADNGAIHAALEAKKAGKTRFIGFTDLRAADEEET